QAAANAVVMVTDGIKPRVQLAAKALHFPCFIGDILMPPTQGHRAQKRKYRCRRCDDHVALNSVLQKLGVYSESSVQERIRRSEQNDELWGRGESLDVVLMGKLLHVGAYHVRIDRK